MRGAWARRWLVDYLVIALLTAIPAVIERLAEKVPAASDLGWLFLPNWSWWWDAPRWHGGWNPWIFAGHPANADPLTSWLHPFSVLYRALTPLEAAAVEAYLLELVAALGMLTYLRAIGCGRLGSIVGGLTFGMGGYIAANAVHPPHLRSAVAIPWALLAIERLNGAALVAGLGATLGWILLGGHPQTIAYSAGLVGLYALCLGRWNADRRLLAMVGGALVASLIGLAVWLPALPLISMSTRAAVTPPFPDPHLTPGEWYWLFTPFQSWLHSGGSLAAFGNGLECGPVECGGYPSLVAWLIVGAAVCFLARERQGRFWIAVAVGALLLSTGLVPLPVGVRGPSRALLWFNVAFSAAAGIGLARILEAASSGRTRRTFVAFLAMSLLVVVAAWQRPWDWGSFVLAETILFLAAIAIVRPHFGRAALLALLAGELIAFQVLLVPFAVRNAAYDSARRPAAQARALFPPTPSGDSAPGRVLLLPAPLSTNWASEERVALVQGYNLLVPHWYAKLLGQRIDLGMDAVGQIDDPALARPASRVLDLLRVELVLRDPSVANPLGTAIAEAAAVRPSWTRLEDHEGFEVYRNIDARPVAWLVAETRQVSPDEELALLRGEVPSETFDDTRTALVRRPLVLDAGPTPGEVQVDAYGEDELRFSVRASGQALLVTSERAYPGWSATVNGVPHPVETVNGGFRGVLVPAGPSEVVLRYSPGITRVALALGAVGLLALLGSLLLAARDRARSRTPRPPTA